MSAAAIRAEQAAERAVATLKTERQALAAAKEANVAARNKARKTLSKTDKAAAQRVRENIKRITARVVKARDKARAAKSRVVELKSRDRVDARVRSIKASLDRAGAAAETRIAARLEKAIATFTRRKRAEIVKAEARKTKKRVLAAEQAIADLRSGKKKRRKRRSSASAR